MTVSKTNATQESTVTVRRISREVSATSVMPNVVMTEKAK
ncbi:hypothetical protein OEIGOIKO_07392 [Streptomyces chrestomyceticus JCM 4735]|uniref:Uncharacterized protein n=1 Tax=Streptomyces chrestomyceticus JCM 4735 TaxID=1306181 RepID=A0A7U9L1X0_9ACTN|nr:hypothetical protein OEIGOIKO_07392 [Streptomyces chrestomyceticus JCM 4735]